VKFKGVIVEFRDEHPARSRVSECKATVAFQCKPNDSFFGREAALNGTPVELSIGNERVELGGFDYDGKYPVNGGEIFLAVENFDKPGKWRVVAERIG
jgi:hypothetical protein